MKKIAIVFFVSIYAFFSGTACKAQLIIDPLASNYNTYAAISNFNIRNITSAPIDIEVRIELSEVTVGTVFTVFQSQGTAQSGSVPYTSLATGATFNFAKNTVSDYLRNNDRLPDGNYHLCYYVNSKKNGIASANFCTDFTIHNNTPLVLISPADGSAICDSRPTFQWVNPSPLPADAKARFVLVEVKDGQSETEAIYRNMPEVNIMEAGKGMLPLPGYVAELKEKTTYAWQVTIYNDAGIIQKSEIWKFKKDCNNPKAVKSSEDAFPQLTRGNEVSVYLVKDLIRFSFINTYSVEKLDYTIIDMETNKPIKDFPTITIRTGINHVEIDVDDCRSLKKGKYYTLKAMNVQSMPLQMRFRYEGE